LKKCPRWRYLGCGSDEAGHLQHPGHILWLKKDKSERNRQPAKRKMIEEMGKRAEVRINQDEEAQNEVKIRVKGQTKETK